MLDIVVNIFNCGGDEDLGVPCYPYTRFDAKGIYTIVVVIVNVLT